MLFWKRCSATYDRINRNALNRKFSVENRNVPIFMDRLKMRHFLNHEIKQNLPIDYLEFVVFGNYPIQEWSTLSISPNSRFYGFDTFTGLTEHWFKNFAKGAFDVCGKTHNILDN